MTESSTVHADAGRKGWGGKAIVILSVALIVLGSLSWTAWDLFGTQGLNPKQVKEMAKAYETECVEVLGTKRACKQHIGRWHRTCLPDGIDRAGPDEEPRPLRYDADAYAACMRSHRDEDAAE
ncbi:MAG: hypothetical protein AAGI01_07180 [Myxococcota bacterium]